MTLDVLLVRLNPRTQINLSRALQQIVSLDTVYWRCATQIHLRSGIRETCLASGLVSRCPCRAAHREGRVRAGSSGRVLGSPQEINEQRMRL